MTDAVAGGRSVAKAKGSALSTVYPLKRERMRYLYRCPAPTPGTNPCQTPVWATGSRRCFPACQSVQSPMTSTDSALGAQTANRVPVWAPSGCGWAPSLSYRLPCVPSASR
jgi:hypothetical protein